MIFNFINKGTPLSEVLIGLLAIILAAVTAIVFHEVAHGYAALKCGDYTAKSAGRLTLNPVPHFDIMGLLAMLLLGFGWARPVPVNPFNFKDYKKGMIMVSSAGVVTNVALGFVGLFLIYIAFLIIPQSSSGSVVYLLCRLVAYFLIYFVQLNFLLAFFNLIPIKPLDGYNLLAVFLKPNSGYIRFMNQYGMWTLIGFLLFCRLLNTIGLSQLDIISQYASMIMNLINRVIEAAVG